MIEQDDRHGPLSRWFGNLAQALMREPAIILLERDGDGPRPQAERDEPVRSHAAL